MVFTSLYLPPNAHGGGRHHPLTPASVLELTAAPDPAQGRGGRGDILETWLDQKVLLPGALSALQRARLPYPSHNLKESEERSVCLSVRLRGSGTVRKPGRALPHPSDYRPLAPVLPGGGASSRCAEGRTHAESRGRPREAQRPLPRTPRPAEMQREERLIRTPHLLWLQEPPASFGEKGASTLRRGGG